MAITFLGRVNTITDNYLKNDNKKSERGICESDRQLVITINGISTWEWMFLQYAKDEIFNCTPYLEKQLELIAPQVLVLLGNCAIKSFLGNVYKLSEVHGKLIEKGQRQCLLTYHPAAVLYNKKLLQGLKEDLKVLKEFV